MGRVLQFPKTAVNNDLPLKELRVAYEEAWKEWEDPEGDEDDLGSAFDELFEQVYQLLAGIGHFKEKP